MSPSTCECSEDYGPCELHCDTLVIREGASQRTGDEITLLKIDDLVDCGVTLSPEDEAERERLSHALTDRWFEDADDAEAAEDLLTRVESNASDVWLISDDGYTIVRPHADCPLVTS